MPSFAFLYAPLLTVHNLMRWVILVLAVYALVRIFMGVFGKREFTGSDRQALSFYTIALDIQLLVGLLLYFFVSPITTSAFSNFGAAMSNSLLRFFTVEHSLMMVVAIVLAHVASVMARRATTSASKFNRAAIWLTLSVLALLAGIPWTQAPMLRLGAMLQQFLV